MDAAVPSDDRETEGGPRSPSVYLVEAYLPRSHAREARAAGRRARAAAEELWSEGVPIRYLRTTFLPDDETCFHVFEAPSIEVVEQATIRAELGHARINPAIEESAPYMPIE